MAAILRDAATRVDRDRLVEAAGRLGLLSRAALWIVMGSLATRLALEGRPKPGVEPDKQGALETLARQRIGTVLLAALVIGFASMVLWSAVEAVGKHRGKRGGHWGHRLAAITRGVIYAAAAASTFPVLNGRSETDSSGEGRFTARLLGWPGGRLIVGAIALGLLAAAGFNLYRAASKRYEKHWDRSRMDARARRIAGSVEAWANVGHAMAFALVGWFLLMAAWRFDPNEPKGLDESLARLVSQPYGRPLCLVVAAGMIAWGLGSLAQARWRKVPAD